MRKILIIYVKLLNYTNYYLNYNVYSKLYLYEVKLLVIIVVVRI